MISYAHSENRRRHVAHGLTLYGGGHGNSMQLVPFLWFPYLEDFIVSNGGRRQTARQKTRDALGEREAQVSNERYSTA